MDFLANPPEWKPLESGDDVSQFTCGDESWATDVSDFLKENALYQQDRGYNRTYLFLAEGVLAGFVSVLSFRISSNPTMQEYTEVGQSSAPAMLIGQFGVATAFQNAHLGEYIWEWTQGLADLQGVGIRFIALHCDILNPAVAWYHRRNFRAIHKSGGASGTLLMVYDRYGPGAPEIEY